MEKKHSGLCVQHVFLVFMNFHKNLRNLSAQLGLSENRLKNIILIILNKSSICYNL